MMIITYVEHHSNAKWKTFTNMFNVVFCKAKSECTGETNIFYSPQIK